MSWGNELWRRTAGRTCVAEPELGSRWNRRVVGKFSAHSGRKLALSLRLVTVFCLFLFPLLVLPHDALAAVGTSDDFNRAVGGLGASWAAVNGQFAVPGGGQLDVPTPWVDQFCCGVIPPRCRACFMR